MTTHFCWLCVICVFLALTLCLNNLLFLFSLTKLADDQNFNFLTLSKTVVCWCVSQVNSPLNGPVLGKAGLVVRNPDFTFKKDNGQKVSKV